MTSDSSPLLDQLTQLGEPDEGFDYLALGITAEHVPELIRIATQRFPAYAPVADEVFWTRPHAWRALAQLRAEAAVEPLVRLLCEGDPDGDDWLLDDLPEALGTIGRATIGPAREASLREEGDEEGRYASVRAIGQVAMRHPGARGEAVEALVGILSGWRTQPPTFNAFAITELIIARAVEAAPLMEAAIKAGAVDLQVTGSWESVQEDLGVVPGPEQTPFVPGPRTGDAPPHIGLRDFVPSRPRPAKSPGETKNRRKDAKAARKRNRRR
jgi:hypothetical protein